MPTEKRPFFRSETIWARPGAHRKDIHDKVVIEAYREPPLTEHDPSQLLLTVSRSAVTDTGEQFILIDQEYTILLPAVMECGEGEKSSWSTLAWRRAIATNAEAIATIARFADWTGLEIFLTRLRQSAIIDHNQSHPSR